MLESEVPMKFSSLWRKHAVIVLLLAVIALVACFYQTQKVGFHEDEVYTIASAVNPGNGLLTAYEDNQMPEHGTPVWKTSQEVRDFVTLNPENYFNHMKFLPEMMIYDHSLILNTTRGELDVLADDPMLEREGRLVVSLPVYLDHSALLEQISQSTGFHQVTTLCTSPDGPRDREVKANLYLVSR